VNPPAISGRGFRRGGSGTSVRMLKSASLLASLALSLGAVGCGSSAKVTTSTNAQGKTALVCSGRVHFAKAKFVLHSGLAFGAFHRYILKPYRTGTFKKDAAGRTKALVKAGASALFAYHELKVARTDAVCDGPRLRQLADTVSGALAALNSLRSLKTGAGLGAIGAASQALDQLGGQAAAGGAPVKDINR
jgi:hypothetical protein